MGRSDLKRGAAAAFGGAADMVMADYQQRLQTRHAEAMERVRHQYRTAERKQTGLLAGQAADVKFGRDMEMQESRGAQALAHEERRAEMRDPGERTRAAERFMEEDPDMTFSKAYSAAGPQRAAGSTAAKYADAGGRTYTFNEIEKMRKSAYPSGYNESGEPVSFDMYLKEKGIQLSGGAPAPGAGAAPGPGGGAQFPTLPGGVWPEGQEIPKQAIDMLRAGEGDAAAFDAQFGEGASASVMEGFAPPETAAEPGLKPKPAEPRPEPEGEPGIVSGAERPESRQQSRRGSTAGVKTYTQAEVDAMSNEQVDEALPPATRQSLKIQHAKRVHSGQRGRGGRTTYDLAPYYAAAREWLVSRGKGGSGGRG